MGKLMNFRSFEMKWIIFIKQVLLYQYTDPKYEKTLIINNKHNRRN